MRLRRLALTNVGGVASSELVVPEQGVSVVLAPNETGKSTQLTAFRLLLSKTAHDGRPQDVKDLQPIGQDIGSTIEAELVIGDDTFTVRRTYNKRPSSALTVTGSRTLTMQGKEADEFLRVRFLDAVDQGLYELLHLAQGRELKALHGGRSATVIAALQRAEGGAPTGGADSIVERLRGRVEKAFDARNGALKGALRKDELTVLEAEEQRDEVAMRIEAMLGDENATNIAEHTAAIEAELAALAGRIARAGAAERAAAARTVLEAATAQARSRMQQVAALDQLIGEEKDQAGAVEAARTDLNQRTARTTALAEQAAAAMQARAELVTAANQAEADLVAVLERTVEKLRAEVAGEPADESALEHVRGLERDVDVATAALASGAWELVARAGRPLILEVDGDMVTLAEGEDLTLPVAASLVIRDTEGTTIDLHADDDRRNAVGRLATATEQLTATLAQHGTDSVAALDTRVAARTRTNARIGELTERLEELHDGPVSEERPEPRQHDGQDLDTLEEALESAVAALAAATDGAGAELDAARAAEAQQQQVLKLKQEELTRSSDRRAAAEQEVATARAERADDALAEAVAAAQSALDALGDVGEIEDVAALEEQSAALTTDLNAAGRDAAVAEDRRRSADALRATLESLDHRAQGLRAELDRQVREAEAARTLLARLEEARAEQGDRYREPLEQRIGELMTRLYDYECRVELDDDLRIIQRSDAEGRMIPWGQLSGGAKEQAAVVTGLAIAELAGDGGVPFWIDDSIVFTDDERVARLKELLAESTAQVIVMTCRSELAEGLPAATFTNGDGKQHRVPRRRGAA